MSAVSQKLVVTKELKALLKRAEKIIISSSHSDTATMRIVCMTGGFEQETEVRLPISIRAYDKMGASRRVHASITSPRYSEHWMTILQIVRPGDELSVYVIAGNNNQYLTRSELYFDSTYLQIDRKGGSLHLLFGTGICPNNSARMVK